MHWADYRSLTSPTNSSDEAKVPATYRSRSLLANNSVVRTGKASHVGVALLTRRHDAIERHRERKPAVGGVIPLQVARDAAEQPPLRAQAATFVDADLSNASITVHFSFDDLRRANFSHANVTVVMANQSMGLLRTEFIAAKLDGADFTGAGLGHVTLRYAKLKSARFNDADLRRAEFDGADLTDANFTGAKVQGATFEGAILAGVTGLDLAAISRQAK